MNPHLPIQLILNTLLSGFFPDCSILFFFFVLSHICSSIFSTSVLSKSIRIFGTWQQESLSLQWAQQPLVSHKAPRPFSWFLQFLIWYHMPFTQLSSDPQLKRTQAPLEYFSFFHSSSMWHTFASSAANLVTTPIHASWEIIIIPRGIPYGLGGTNWIYDGTLKVHVASIYVPSVCDSTSVVKTIAGMSVWSSWGKNPTIISVAYLIGQAKGLAAL